MQIEKTSLVSYIALGVSVVALVVAIFGGCHKPRPFGFGPHGGPRPEMMGGPRDGGRGGHFRNEPEQRPDMREKPGFVR